MSLARDLIDAALAADLTQNELRVFLALFRQTLCYGKTADPLTLKRLAKLTYIRKDRLIPAIASVLDKGLFDAYPHPIFEHEYHIPPSFQVAHTDGFFTPALPKNRENFRFPGDISEKQEHTALNLTAMNLTPTTTPPQSASAGEDNAVEEPLNTAALPYPPTFKQQELTSAARILDGLNPQDAHDCLRLLNASMQTNKVKSPLGYLHKLAQAARQHKLDRSTLQVSAPPETKAARSDTAQQARLRTLADDIRGIDALFACAGIPLDALNAAKRARWVEEYNALREQMLPTDVVEKAC